MKHSQKVPVIITTQSIKESVAVPSLHPILPPTESPTSPDDSNVNATTTPPPEESPPTSNSTGVPSTTNTTTTSELCIDVEIKIKTKYHASNFEVMWVMDGNETDCYGPSGNYYFFLLFKEEGNFSLHIAFKEEF